LFDTTQISNPPPPLPVRLLLAFRRSVRYVARFERHRPDAVLLFAAVGASLVEKGLMAWYAKLRGVPAFLFPRGGGIMDACKTSRIARLWVRTSFGGARKVFCQSERWQRFAVDVLKVPRQNAPIIANWTASEELLEIGRARPRTSGNHVRLLFVGWFDREKGAAELLHALREIAAERTISLDVVGEGNYSAEGRAYVARHNLAESVRFRGWLSGEALRQQFAHADVFVLPSWAEGLPNAMIEAMAARLAIVVTHVGGIPDVIVDQMNGMLVPPRNTDALREALRRVIDDSALRNTLADAAHGLAAERFSVERAVEELLKHCELSDRNTRVT
jgi:glycosyltransferase involved in cell wall biosynthesis